MKFTGRVARDCQTESANPPLQSGSKGRGDWTSRFHAPALPDCNERTHGDARQIENAAPPDLRTRPRNAAFFRTVRTSATPRQADSVSERVQPPEVAYWNPSPVPACQA